MKRRRSVKRVCICIIEKGWNTYTKVKPEKPPEKIR